MPNHVTNELIFRNISLERQAEILAKIVNSEGRIDFGILVPVPINVWRGNVSTRHEKAFRKTAMDWTRENWGTKWNAYEIRPIVQTDDTLTVTFDTAWSPPFPWLAAVFNGLKVSFDHNWFDEGQDHAHADRFDYAAFESENWSAEPWVEAVATEEEYRRMHILKYGVERFEDEEEDA